MLTAILPLHIHTQNSAAEGIVAHILPVSDQGPQYEKNREFYIATPELDVAVPAADGVQGVIVTLFAISASGSYDTIEWFTPRHANWQLNGPAGTLVDRKCFMPIQGRQQFAPVYSYDGSCCLLNGRVLENIRPNRLTPFILNRACFISDELDYLLYTA